MATDVNRQYPEAMRLVREIEHSLRQLADVNGRTDTHGGYYPSGAGAGAGAGAGGQNWRPAAVGSASAAPDSEEDKQQRVSALLNAASRDLNALTHQLVALQKSAQRQPAPRRDLWKSRVHALSETVASLRRELELILSRSHRRQKEEANRIALLGNANSVVIDCAIKESESLAKSNNMMDELIDAGSNVMASLTSQGDMLKRAHMKALEMANTLGLSNSLMRVIQRRTSGDKVLVYGGMVLITILLYFVYRFTRAA